MHHISVSAEVFTAIWSLRGSSDTCEDAILRRLLAEDGAITGRQDQQPHIDPAGPAPDILTLLAREPRRFAAE